MDPNSSAFAAFAAQPPGYYTPTPGGSTLGFQSYDLAVNPHSFNPPDSLTNLSHVSMPGPSMFEPHLHALEQANYMHFRPNIYSQDGYQNLSMPGAAVGGPECESSPDTDTPASAPISDPELYLAPVAGKFMNTGKLPSQNRDVYGQYVSYGLTCSSLCRFRFSTKLHASTAMVKRPDEIPVSYLNKRQVYMMSVVDTSSEVRNKELKRYRTSIRIAFDEDEQRRNAPECWRLWRDGRGIVESGGNPDKLRALEYGIIYPMVLTNVLEPLEARTAAEKKLNGETELRLDESSSGFDRFSLVWTSTSTHPELYFSIRFCFLSTDFSHSKGVKGIPLRLVAKTELLGTGDSVFQSPLASELAYCKVQSFRDKGAERKLAYDRQQQQRTIDKLRQQRQQLQLGSQEEATNNAKRRKRHSISALPDSRQSSPTQKRHKRDWSFSSVESTNSVGSGRRHPEDELERNRDQEIALLAQFESCRPISILNLIGDPADDPSLPFSPIPPQRQWDPPGVYATEPLVALEQGSPALSSNSFSPARSEKMTYHGTEPLVHPHSPPDATRRNSGVSGMMMNMRISQKVQAATKYVDAMDVDPYYISLPAPTFRPGTSPSHGLTNPIALCVYIAQAKIGPTGDPHTMHLATSVDPKNDIYYAVYVPSRTASSLASSIAAKLGIPPKDILRTTIINKRGLRLALDDDVAREMLEKQDMRVAVREIETSPPPGQLELNTGAVRGGLELLLAF